MTAVPEEQADRNESFGGIRVYCSGPIRGDTSFVDNYHHLIEMVNELGAMALAESGNDIRRERNKNDDGKYPPGDRGIYKRDMEWLESSHCVVAEVSAPSHGAGFEISYALFVMNIPVLIFHSRKGKRLSAMLQGCDLPNITVIHYSDFGEIEVRLREFLHRVSKKKRTESL